MNYKNSLGLTFIEIAIAIFIATILMGIVLTYRSLLGVWYVKAQEMQIEEYRAAINLFEVRFFGLPGDFDKADIYSFGENGDGNRVIGDNVDLGEPQLFWRHLGAAEVIDYDVEYGELPKAKIGEGFITIYYNKADSESYFHIGHSQDFKKDALTPLEAYQIDLKFDDGNPATGQVLASAAGFDYGLSPVAGTLGEGKDACVTKEYPKRYYFESDTRRCSLDVVLRP